MNESTVTHRFNKQQYASQFWAGKLVQCMQKMGDMQTNAVLLSLDGAKQIKPYQHYPESTFTFGNGDWKVFYHCHHSPDHKSPDNNLQRNKTQEHGHFHFFTRVESSEADPASNKWSHVIAMGMNELGQPTRLFTTNLWVTDGEWFNTKRVQQQLNKLRGSEEDDLSSMWFQYLLLIFENEIEELLSERDQVVEQHYPKNIDQCFVDRSIYYLSSLDIDLNEKLMEVFQPVYQDNS